MATIGQQTPAREATAITFSAAAGGGDKFENSGRDYLIVRNASGAPVNLTIVTPATTDGLAIADRVVAIGDGETHVLGPWQRDLYNDGDGFVNLTWSSAAGMTLAVIRV